jgi:hypothetical protein
LGFIGTWGCHCFRKTAFLFGAWGGQGWWFSARHASLINALKYKQDASFLLEIALENDEHIAITVPKFKSLYIIRNQAAVALNHNYSQIMKDKAVSSLAKQFVQVHLRISSPNTWKKQVMNIGEELLSYSNTYGKINDLKQELIDILKTLPEATADRLTILIGMADLKLTLVVEHVIVDEIIDDEDITQIVSKRRKRGGVDEVAGRNDIAKEKDPTVKLDLILKANVLAVNIDPANRTESLSKWLSDVAHPISFCLENHYHGNRQISYLIIRF